MRATSQTLRVVSYILWLPVSFHWPCNPRALCDFPGKEAAAVKLTTPAATTSKRNKAQIWTAAAATKKEPALAGSTRAIDEGQTKSSY